MRPRIALSLSILLMLTALFMVFIYVPTDKGMGVIQRIFYFHVPVAWIAFAAFFVTFVASIVYLVKRKPWWDFVASASAEIGLIFTTLVLITGSIWGKSWWTVWWTWDARLTSSLVLWLIYIAYFIVRAYVSEEERRFRYAAVIGIVGFIDVPIVALSIQLWSRKMHPPALIFEGGLTPPMLATLLVSIAAFSAVYCTFLFLRIHLKEDEYELNKLKETMRGELNG
jgi:heme exporter protein C